MPHKSHHASTESSVIVFVHACAVSNGRGREEAQEAPDVPVDDEEEKDGV